jgi:hypothetical protein
LPLPLLLPLPLPLPSLSPVPVTILVAFTITVVGKSQFSTPRLATDRRIRVARISRRAGTARRTEQVRSKQ